MPKGFNYLLLATACSFVLAVAAGASPAPAWNELGMANDYGHVTFTQVGNTFNFTVFNDQGPGGLKICGWALYPTATLNGIVPVVNGAPPLGWASVGWEGPVSGLGPQFGDIRDSFVTTMDLFNIAPGASQSGFSVTWIGATLPTDLKFGIALCSPYSAPVWYQAGPNPCIPIPDASTLLLVATGGLAAIPSLRRSLRRRA